jgi:nidogen-like/cadherin-like protein
VAPVAVAVTLSDGTEDALYTIQASDLLAGVTDIDSTTLSVTSVSIASGGGSLVNHGDGTWTYTPAANYNGPVSFNYTASDGSLTSSPTARLNLVAVNDAPTISAGTVASGAISVPVTPQNHVSAAVASALATSGLISGLPGESGFGALALGAGDDNSSGAINITSVFGASGVNFFGHNYTSLYVNNNGNITFNAPTSAFTPSVINAGTNNPIIAAFWADVDTRRAGAVYYDLDAADGIMTITWDHVGYYSAHHNKFDTFQIVLISEGNGNFDIEYRYNNIQWTTGDASGGANGLNGTSARAGYSAGDGMHYFELPQSGNQSALLSLPTTNGNTGIAGVDHFEVRNGEVGPSTLTSTGTINFSDPDLNDIHAIQSVTYTGSGDHLGTLTLVKNADTTGTGIGGKFTWTYTADPTAIRTALDGLSTHSKVETFDVMISDGAGGTVTQSVAVTLTETGNHAPVINVDNLHVTQHGGGTTTVSGLSVTDSDATSNEIFTVAATTAGAASGTTVTPATGSGHLADINATLATGVTYHEGNTPPSTDRVAVSVADGHGATDTVSMIFSNAAEHGAALTFTGTTGKDVFFATGHQDQFVFAAHFNHDTIMNFAPGQDHLDLSAVVTTNNPGDWISAHVAASPANPADTLITVDAADTIVLHGVSTAGLSANDFILHPGTA